jgi:hypothetical protein
MRSTDGLRGWLLLDLNRWVLTAAVLGGLFVAVVALGTLDPVPLREAVSGSDPVETLFQALVTAIVTGVTLVVTINQLVLSQELGAVGDQRERMEGATSFRADAAAAMDEPTAPADPAAFLRALVEAAGDRADALAASVGPATDDRVRRAVEAYADDLRGAADDAGARLAGERFGSFDVLRAALVFRYGPRLHEARRLRGAHDLDPETAAALGAVEETLALFGPAREHVKTLYFQWELIGLSRAVLYAAVPALVVAVSMLLFGSDAGVVTGTVLGVDALLLTVAAATAVGLLPFALLLSYILRIATVAKRTLAIGPFVLRDR